MSKLEFKELVKEAVRELAFKYLQQLRESHRKAEDLVYENLNLQNYLLAGSKTQMTIHERQFLFALRTQMVDVKANFKIGQGDIRCRACSQAEESQEHILQCPELQEKEIVMGPIDYQDLFKNDTEKLAQISRIIQRKLKLLNEQVTMTNMNPSNGSFVT